MEEWLQEKTHGASLGVKKSSTSVFFCNEGVQVRNFVEKSPLSFISCRKRLSAEKRSARSE
jgi:hypothetical protein